MKTMYVVAGLTALLVAGVVFAQSDSDYQNWMKSNGAAMASLQKNVAAKDGNGVAADANTIAGNLKQVEAFWTKRGGAPDAVNFAKMGRRRSPRMLPEIWMRLPPTSRACRAIAAAATWRTARKRKPALNLSKRLGERPHRFTNRNVPATSVCGPSALTIRNAVGVKLIICRGGLS
jgi:hypothetical protein